MLYIPIVYAHDVSKQIPWEKNFALGWKCYKTIGSYVSCAFIEIWSTWEVWRALKKLELLSATPRATLTHLSCSPNFPRASYLDERMLMCEPIVKQIMNIPWPAISVTMTTTTVIMFTIVEWSCLGLSELSNSTKRSTNGFQINWRWSWIILIVLIEISARWKLRMISKIFTERKILTHQWYFLVDDFRQMM